MGQREYPRQNRVNEEIRRTLGQLIPELRDPRLGLVTVTEVEVTRDYSQAKVFVSMLKTDDPAASIDALNHASGFLRRELARATAMRTTPKLRFVHDQSIERAARLDELIDRGLPDED
ncbi:MAG TPA: 30S ribosome-binding factor RbfA [Gammaproteobacteria bacterium]|nr:30S ribosome-binding factor RbfA [Gammaproteobacteria bacterium]